MKECERHGQMNECIVPNNHVRLSFFPFRSPRGAIRFLELVRFGVYNGVAFNRVVPNFLTQFGIPKDYEMRKDAREISIWDDFNQRLPFEPGYVSFAGSGFDSRTTELFIVMPGVSKAQ